MGELHCLQVGCADCTVIKSAQFTFLVDCHGIEDHSYLLPSNKKINGVFITHQHYDHFDGLEYLKNQGYTIDNIVSSPYNRRHNDGSVQYHEWNSFNNYVDYFKKLGTKTYAPYRQSNFTKAFWDTKDGISFSILGPNETIAKSETRELHDACLVILARLNKRQCLFTGDASDKSLSHIADNTQYFCDDILHASHHGSINGADLDFIQKCNASYCVVSTKSGVHSNVPSDVAMKRYRTYTKEVVYRTDIDGTLKFSF